MAKATQIMEERESEDSSLYYKVEQLHADANMHFQLAALLVVSSAVPLAAISILPDSKKED